jgi:hypothetical protein
MTRTTLLHRQALAVALGRESFGGEPTGDDQLLRPAAQDLPAGHAGAVGGGACSRSAPQPGGGCHRHRQDGGCGIRLSQHVPQRRGRPRLLFVAHREEILRQALRTYREVLRDPEFGDLLTGGHVPRAGTTSSPPSTA